MCKTQNYVSEVVFDIAASDFGFVSGFGFRVSDFLPLARFRRGFFIAALTRLAA
jgi:hypothetical protein